MKTKGSSLVVVVVIVCFYHTAGDRSPFWGGTGKPSGKSSKGYRCHGSFQNKFIQLISWLTHGPKIKTLVGSSPENISQASALIIFLMLHISGYNGLSYLKSSQIIAQKVDFNYSSYPTLLGTHLSLYSSLRQILVVVSIIFGFLLCYCWITSVFH